MKTAKKIWMIIAVCLIIIGAIICFASIKSLDFDFAKFNTAEFKTKTYTVKEDFDNISILGSECDISFKLADDGVCKIECSEGESLSHFIEVKDNRLVIERIDERKWYQHIGVYFGEIHLTVYLPDYSYDSLIIASYSGDVEISKDFAFNNAEIITSSGKINFTARVSKELKLGSSSGEIYASEVMPKELNVYSSSGDISLDNIECEKLVAKSASGEIKLNDILVSGDLEAKSTSGDIGLEGCDAQTLYLQSNSGDIDGRLLSEKTFDATTTSGEVLVPDGASGGKCRIVTTSGDIEFELKK
ncbi:MAG: DUF4097 family beta strand repeat protein [Clostridia bacterium]|nr:DUF4097 family beta strand repeat protein [Clostridia bacterium]